MAAAIHTLWPVICTESNFTRVSCNHHARIPSVKNEKSSLICRRQCVDGGIGTMPPEESLDCLLHEERLWWPDHACGRWSRDVWPMNSNSLTKSGCMGDRLNVGECWIADTCSLLDTDRNRKTVCGLSAVRVPSLHLLSFAIAFCTRDKVIALCYHFACTPGIFVAVSGIQFWDST